MNYLLPYCSEKLEPSWSRRGMESHIARVASEFFPLMTGLPSIDLFSWLLGFTPSHSPALPFFHRWRRGSSCVWLLRHALTSLGSLSVCSLPCPGHLVSALITTLLRLSVLFLFLHIFFIISTILVLHFLWINYCFEWLYGLWCWYMWNIPQALPQ